VTLGEIYDSVVNLVYGDVNASPVPLAEIPFIRTLILQKHREVQRDYNFWFNRVRTTLDLTAGISTYPLPAEYKEFIKLDCEGECELIGENLVFLEAPLLDKTVTFDLWQYIPTPAAWNAAHTDAVTRFCHMAIIYMVTAIVMLKRDEKTQAGSYLELGAQALESVYAEDYKRRQSPGAVF